MPATPGTWTEAHVRRLFWRAAFGATPAEAKAFAARGKAATIKWLLNGGPVGRCTASAGQAALAEQDGDR